MQNGGRVGGESNARRLVFPVFIILTFAVLTSTSFASSTILDGSASNGCGYKTACNVSLTTNSNPDVIIVACDCFPTGNTFTVSDTSGLTWTQRASIALGGGQEEIEWYAVANSKLNSDRISVKDSYTGETWYGVSAFGVAGANTTSIFDTAPAAPPGYPQISLPRAEANNKSCGTYPCVINVAVITSNDFVFALGGDTGSTLQTAGTGDHLITSSKSGEDEYAEYNVTFPRYVSDDVSFGTSQGSDFAVIVDAIKTASGNTTITTSTTSTSTSTSTTTTILAVTKPSMTVSSSNAIIIKDNTERYTFAIYNGIGPFQVELFNITGDRQQGSNAIVLSPGGSNTISFQTSKTGTFTYNVIVTDMGENPSLTFSSRTSVITVLSAQKNYSFFLGMASQLANNLHKYMRNSTNSLYRFSTTDNWASPTSSNYSTLGNGFIVAGFIQEYKATGNVTYLNWAVNTSNQFYNDIVAPATNGLYDQYYPNFTPETCEQPLQDEAFWVIDYLSLYQVNGSQVWLQRANKTENALNRVFWDPVNNVPDEYFTGCSTNELSGDVNIEISAGSYLWATGDWTEVTGNTTWLPRMNRTAYFTWNSLWDGSNSVSVGSVGDCADVGYLGFVRSVDSNGLIMDDCRKGTNEDLWGDVGLSYLYNITHNTTVLSHINQDLVWVNSTTLDPLNGGFHDDTFRNNTLRSSCASDNDAYDYPAWTQGEAPLLTWEIGQLTNNGVLVSNSKNYILWTAIYQWNSSVGADSDCLFSNTTVDPSDIFDWEQGSALYSFATIYKPSLNSSTSTTTTTTVSTTSTSSSTVTTTIPSSTFGIDGSANNGCGYKTTCNVTLTTNSNPDVIIVACDCYPSTNTFTVSDTSGLTWTQRSSVNLGGGQIEVEWYAIANSKLNSDRISVKDAYTGETWYGITAFGIAGANATSPFDSNSTLPRADANDKICGKYPCATHVGTSNANDLIFAVGGDTGGTLQTAGTGSDLITSSRSGEDEYAEYSISTSTVNNKTISFGTEQSYDFAVIADAVKAAPSQTNTTIIIGSSSCSSIGGVWTTSSNTCTLTTSYTTSGHSLVIPSGATLVVNSSTESGSWGIIVSNESTITVDSGGNLTIENNGNGILNFGTISNSGTINIENSGYGIGIADSNMMSNVAYMYNYGTINIENSGSGSEGIDNGYGTITNAGTINIENSGDDTGIDNGPIGYIDSSDIINIRNSGTDSYGIYDDNGYLTNSGTINVENSGTDSYGIYSMSASEINNSGTINIDNTGSGSYGVYPPLPVTSTSTSSTSTSTSLSTSSTSTSTSTTSSTSTASSSTTTVSSSALGLDGSASNGCGYKTACNVTLTTNSGPDVVIVGCDCFPTGNTFTVSDTSGLTWTQRASIALGGGQVEVEWYAIANSKLNSDKISVKDAYTGETWYGVSAFGISGANTTDPFDFAPGPPPGYPSISLPRAEANNKSCGTYPCVINVAVISSNDFVFALGGDTGSTLQSAGTGDHLITSSKSGEDEYAEYNVIFPRFMSENVSFGTSQGSDFAVIADAVRAAADPPASTSTTSTSTSTSTSVSTSTSTTTVITGPTLPSDVPSNVIYYIPLMITNSQSSSIGSGFQQEVTVNALKFRQYFVSNLTNAEFFYANGTIIPSWLEGNYLNESQKADLSMSGNVVYWLKLSDDFLLASSSNMLYLGFAGNVITPANTLMNGVTTGEAPQLSNSYAALDNGYSVFPFYENFKGTTLNTTKWGVSKYGMGNSSVNNGITISAPSNVLDGYNDYYFIYSNQIFTYPKVAEMYLSAASNSTGFVVAPELGVSTTTANDLEPALVSGYAMIWHTSVSVTNHHLEYFACNASNSTGGCNYLLPGYGYITTPLHFGAWSITWAATGSEYFSDGNVSNSMTDNSLAIANYHMYLGDSALEGGHNGTVTVQWARVRSYPPNGVMPQIFFGNVT